MRKKIKIGKPFIKENTDSLIFDESIQLCANVTMENPNNHKIESKVCYYEFDKKYKKYLCDNRSDAFVMGLLTTAMENDMDIEFESPISEKLYYQLSTYYIPLVSKNNSSYPMYDIKIAGPTDNKIIKNEKAVATGCSGGVDSFYTIAKHTSNDIPKSYKLTHIVCSSSGTSDFTQERVIKNFKNTFDEIQKIADDCNLNAIVCYNNLYEFYKVPFKGFQTFANTTYGSIAFALQKLISIYYLSSGPSLTYFNMDINVNGVGDASSFDLLTAQCITSENISFYSTGMELDRIEKQEYISDFEPAKKNLKVCGAYEYIKDLHFINCSRCKKCIRTMSHLYVLGKLDNFKDVFDVEYFYKNKNKLLGKFLGIDHGYYIKKTSDMGKKYNHKIPLLAYFYCYCLYKPLKFFKKLLKDSKIIKKIYYKSGIDIKINGYRDPAHEFNKKNK